MCHSDQRISASVTNCKSFPRSNILARAHPVCSTAQRWRKLFFSLRQLKHSEKSIETFTKRRDLSVRACQRLNCVHLLRKRSRWSQKCALRQQPNRSTFRLNANQLGVQRLPMVDGSSFAFFSRSVMESQNWSFSCLPISVPLQTPPPPVKIQEAQLWMHSQSWLAEDWQLLRNSGWRAVQRFSKRAWTVEKCERLKTALQKQIIIL